jgi:competence protein ComEC
LNPTVVVELQCDGAVAGSIEHLHPPVGKPANDLGMGKAVAVSIADRESDSACLAGADWHWEGVDFSILHPRGADDGRGNDGSCVLKVAAPGGRLLLPGDLEKSGEAAVLLREAERLRAEVLVVPHHGGRNSSTGAFLDAVRPRMALIPVGHRNRYRFPHAQVLRRLSDRGVETFDTARHGAITLKYDSSHGVRRPRLERTAVGRIWRTRD